MGVEVKVRVQLPDGKPVPGAQIVATNHDAWSAKHREWKGTTNSDGVYQWANVDRGTLGDRYTFRASSPDVNGAEWVGEVSERVVRPSEFVIVLHKAEHPHDSAA